jgi:branched-chain amino acid transport system substrate-binding protein
MSGTRRRLLLLALVASLALLARAEAAGPLKIGIIAPQTGNLATDGNAYLGAAQAVIEAKNAAGGIQGRKIEVIAYDEKGQVNEAVNAVRRLLTEDRVAVVLSGSTSGNFLATMPLLNQYRTPALAIATSPKVTEGGNRYAFRIAQLIPDRVRDNVQLAKELRAKTVGFLQVNDETQRVFVKSVKDLIEKEGTKTIFEEWFQYGDSDFSAYLSKLRQAAPDIVYLGGEVTQCATILRQAKESGIKAALVLPTSVVGENLLKAAGAGADGAYGQTIWVPSALTTPEARTFEALMKQKGLPSSYYSVIGYTEAQIALAALEKAGDDPEKLRDAIAASSIPSPLGPIRFDKNGHGNAVGRVFQVRGGLWNLVK